jgi:hypothetical protein
MSVTISNEFIAHVREILFTAIAESKSKTGVKSGINTIAHNSFPAYICAVSSVEAFLNETLLSTAAKWSCGKSPLWDLEKDWYEKLELMTKLVIIPQLLFNKTFKRDQQPYQDMVTLNKIRNDLIHYKMERNIPGYLKDLDQKGITLSAKHLQKDSDFAWPHKLSCTEGIRWANNTVCEVVKTLYSFMPENLHTLWFLFEKNFQIISEQDIIELYNKFGIDPYANNP